MIGCMSTAPDSWEHLAQLVRDRRAQLGITQDQAVARGGTGLNRTTLGQIETAKRNMISAKTEYALTRALEWTEDSVQRIHKGMEPITITEARERSRGVSTVEVIESDPGLDPNAVEVLLGVYRSLLRQVADRR